MHPTTHTTLRSLGTTLGLVIALAAWPLAAAGGDAEDSQAANTALKSPGAGALDAKGIQGAAPNALPDVQDEAPEGAGQSPRNALPGGTRNALEDLRRDLGGGPERLQELERLQRAQEAGGLALELGALEREGDCGPGVRAPAGHADRIGGCAGSPREDGRRERGEGRAGPLGGLPGQPERRGGPNAGGFIRPGEPSEGPATFAGPRGAKDDAGLRDPRGQARQDSGGGGSRYDVVGEFSSSDGHIVVLEDRESGDRRAGEVTGEFNSEYGRVLTLKDRETGEDLGSTRQKDGEWTHRDAVDMRFTEEEADADDAGGEAGQPNPVDAGEGGDQPWSCGLPGFGNACKRAAEARESEYEKARDAARREGEGGITPAEAFEQAGQPVPTPGRDAATAVVEGREGKAGFSPGCDAEPGGCGGAGASDAAGSAAEAAGAGALSGVEGEAGFTPGCDAEPGGCGGSAGLREAGGNEGRR